jgi:hypothetical protein
MQVQIANAVVQNPVRSNSGARSTMRVHENRQEVKLLNRVNLRSFLVRQHGKFVSLDFKKLSGEPRTITGRLGVVSYLKGGQNTVEADSRPYLTMFDIGLRQYRSVSLDTVSHVRALGYVWVVID